MSVVRDFAPARRLRRSLLTLVLLFVVLGLGLHIGTVLFPAGHGAGTSTAPTWSSDPCGPLPTVPVPGPPVPTTQPAGVVSR